MYTLIARIGFTDKYDNTKKYVANEVIEVEEERALELLSSETPVVKFVSRELSPSDEKLISEIEDLKLENANLVSDKETLKTTITTLKAEIETLENENKDLKSKKKNENKTE